MTRARGVLRSAGALLAAVAFAVLPQAPTIAHEERPVGKLSLVVGWLEEPALAGFKNAVQVIASRSEEPVEGGRFRVVVIFGDRNNDTRSEPLALEPLFGAPGEYSATVIPSRPGKYTFHITGRVGGTRINEFFTSGPQSFDEVRNPADVQFPARDPTPAELGARLDRVDARVGEALDEIRALSAASGPDMTTLILAGAGAAMGALALAITLFRRPATGR